MNKRHKKNRSAEIRLLAATYGLAAALSAALAVPSFAAPTAANPLAAATTIQVRETSIRFDKYGGVMPDYSVMLRIARPDQVNALFTIDYIKTPGKNIVQYVDNGETEIEYQSGRNTYTTSPSAKGRSKSQFRDMAEVNLILGSGHPAAPDAGVQRTVATETLDDIPMTVTTDTSPAETNEDGSTSVFVDKVWVNAQTGFPYRDMGFLTTGGKTAATQEITFSDWVLNKPLAKNQLAFAPSAGATLYTPPKLLAVGTAAPDFSAVTSDGKTVHLSDYKGKTVVLDFWATWCGPCQASMPHLESVYQQVKEQNVAVLSLCVWDKKDAYMKWVADKSAKYTFPTAFDSAGRGPQNIARKLYGVRGIPTQYVIDKDGKVAATNVGYLSGDHFLETELISQGVNIPNTAQTATAAIAPRN